MNYMKIPSLYSFLFMYFFSFFLVMSSEDWFLVWFGLEINMMSFIMLIYNRCNVGSVESCFKYFFIQSLGSAILLSLFYNMIFSNFIFVNMILSYSIGAGPFFYWFPSLCMGIEWMSCFVLMFFQKVLPLLLMSIFIHMILWFILFISLIVGVLGSFNQSNIKQLMAYSSVHHLGWIMMIMMMNNINWILYLILYGFMFFSILIFLKKYEVMCFSTMYMMDNKFWFIMGMLSMAGMPPLLGFFLKWMALSYLMSMMLIMFLILISVIMLYIYVQMIYDIMMSGKMEIDWMEFNGNKIMYNFDMMGFMGVGMGMVLGILIII